MIAIKKIGTCVGFFVVVVLCQLAHCDKMTVVLVL